MTGWEEIEKRPSGEVVILVTNGAEVVVVCAADIYREHNGDGEEPGPPMIRSRGDLGRITHWMPLPEPPPHLRNDGPIPQRPQGPVRR